MEKIPMVALIDVTPEHQVPRTHVYRVAVPLNSVGTLVADGGGVVSCEAVHPVSATHDFYLHKFKDAEGTIREIYLAHSSLPSVIVDMVRVEGHEAQQRMMSYMRHLTLPPYRYSHSGAIGIACDEFKVRWEVE